MDILMVYSLKSQQCICAQCDLLDKLATIGWNENSEKREG